MRPSYGWIGCWISLFLAAGVAGGWQWQNPVPTANRLWGLDCFSPNIGWAVGECGTVVYTTDAGQSWQVQPSGVEVLLRAVCFADTVHGWAVGDSGTIIHTDDGGDTWSRQTSPTTYALYDVTFVDPDTGWIVANDIWYGNFPHSSAILHTTDGGATWTWQHTWPHAALYSIVSTSGHTVWAAGYDRDYATGAFLRTNDAGNVWLATHVGREQTNLRVVCFADSLHGWVGGLNSPLLETTDGGATWDSTLGTSLSYFRDTDFADTSRGWALESGGTLHRTTDGGDHWIALEPSLLSRLSAVAAGGGPVLLGLDWEGRVMRSLDGGDLWHELSRGERRTLHAAAAADEQHAWAVGDLGTILRTTDRGVSWQVQTAITVETLTDIEFAGGNGWISGPQSDLLRSTDGGASWQLRPSGLNFGFLAVSFIDALHGWATGGPEAPDRGHLYRTTDGGESWQQIGQTTVPANTQLCFADLTHGWLLTASGRVLRTATGGQSWGNPFQPAGVTIRALACVDTSHAWAVGSRGRIYHSQNGGVNWQLQDTCDGLSEQVAVRFADRLCGWTVNADGRVYATTDGGATWSPQAFLMPGLAAIAAVNASCVWMAGDRGAIVHDSGFSGAAPEWPAPRPAALDLRAFPNPFNARATLLYTLPRAGRVQVMLYDLAGRRVRMLVDDVRAAGTHRVTVDGTGLASGLYFALLSTPTVHTVQKLVLLK